VKTVMYKTMATLSALWEIIQATPLVFFLLYFSQFSFLACVNCLCTVFPCFYILSFYTCFCAAFWRNKDWYSTALIRKWVTIHQKRLAN